MTAPLAKSAFSGIETIAHLAAGGETPALVSHQAALARFLADKSGSMPGRERMFATVARLKADLGRLLGVPAADIGLLASASEGLFVAARGFDWRPGDNVVVALSEFPSVLHAWRAADLPVAEDGARVTIAGSVICRQRPGTAKGFVFISLEDETGIANAIVKPNLFERDRLTITQEAALQITGRLQNSGGVIHVRADTIEPLTFADLPAQASHDFR